MGFVKERPIPADGVELLKAHDLWTEGVAYRNYWTADKERKIYLIFTEWPGPENDFATTYEMILQNRRIRIVTERFKTIKDAVWEGNKLVEYGESEADIRFLDIPEKLKDKREEILKTFEESVSVMEERDVKIGKIL